MYTRKALDKKYINDNSTRQKVSLLFIAIGPLIIGLEYTWNFLPNINPDSLWSSLLCALGGAIGGIFYHQKKTFGIYGLLSGLVVSVGSFWACHFYIYYRSSVLSIEFIIPIILGSIPGVLLYFLLLRNKRIEPDNPEIYK